MPVDAAGLGTAIRQGRLLEPAQADELGRLQASFPEPRALAAELIRRGWLTPYQINQLMRGRGRDLLLGSYVLQERLGEGGMGEVFKARNWKLGHTVALKLIRKMRLDHPDAVRRFHREIRAAAQLDHPNIVRAFDADEVNGTHLLVMEYVQGTDLAKQIKQGGPLAVDKACDYVRQAAQGLQHAHERGMVHRDIKPHNLLLTPSGVVKILDMGLARLDRGTDDGASSTMTQEGAVMGTLDYISPEQAMDSHDVDIRADLYSLGCTLYFLLTGKVPFPGGEALQKLMKHRLDEPVPVEQLRRDVPPAVAAVVRKLMAKRPDDRYQTPAEAAAALTATEATPAQEVPDAADRTAADDDTDAALRWVEERRRRRKAQERRRLTIYAVGGLLSLGLVGLFVALLLRFGLPAPHSPTAPVPPGGPKPAPGPEVRTDPFDQWLKDTAALPSEDQVKAVMRKLQDLNPGFDGKETHKVERGAVTELAFLTDNVTDISPVQALAGLRILKCGGVTDKRMGRLADLSPLKDMKLKDLSCGDTRVSDLSPLRDMSLTSLNCWETGVSDLSPLKDMKLTHLACWGTPVADLSPLKDMPLTYLNCSWSRVSDLSPLKDMKLAALECEGAPVSDLSPLKDMPLQDLRCNFQPWRDKAILRSITTLTWINGKPAADFWKGVDERQAAFEAWCKEVAALPAEQQWPAVAEELKKRNPDFHGAVTPTIENGVVTELAFLTDNVTDLSPVRALPGLMSLNCQGSGDGTGRLSDLSPLKGMSLTSLNCGRNRVSDLSPLKGMPLTRLICTDTPVSDFSPLKDLPLKELYCDFQLKRDAEILRSIKTLQTINGQPTAEVLK